MFHITVTCTQDSFVSIYYTVEFPFDVNKTLNIIDEKLLDRMYHCNDDAESIDNSCGITYYISEVSTDTPTNIQYSTDVKTFLQQIYEYQLNG